MKIRTLGWVTVIVSLWWICMTIMGEFIYAWAGNTACLKYIGCTQGFLGYDAFEHLFFGIAVTLLIVFLSKRFSRLSVLENKKWKSFLVIIGIVMLVAILWEVIECVHDAIRLDVLHESLLNFRLHINLLDQPTNLDTMGDLTFTLIGAIIGFFISL